MANAVNLPGDRLAGLIQDQLAKLRAGNLTLDELALFLQRKNPFPSRDIFNFEVDYHQSLEEMVAAGGYDWKYDDFTSKRYPVSGEGIVKFEARYFHFNRKISSRNAIEEIEAADTANPWSAAQLEHVLAHGATHPDEQRKFPIIGLGSVALVGSRPGVPELGKDGSLRYLGLRWFDGGWLPYYRFLAVRKVSGS